MNSPAPHSTVSVSLGDRSYKIALGTDLLASTPAFITDWLADRGEPPRSDSRALLVTDTNAARYAAPVQAALNSAGYRTTVLSQMPGETTKSTAAVGEMYDALADLPADRNTLVIAVGGGVVGDAAGFAAATFARGIPFVQIPTTLLAMVDSAVGGKVGVNHPRGKNLIGAFHQPIGVIIDLATLATLPIREYRAGLAEVIKYGIILDSSFFSELEANVEALNDRQPNLLQRIVSRCCELKARVVEQDEFERTGLRAVLNYGHTFGHAFETLSGYGMLLHGEAVSMGMMYAARLALRLGRVPAEFVHRQHQLLKAVGLPTSLPVDLVLDEHDILAAMRMDKKSAGGKLRFVLPTRLGHVELVNDVSDRTVREVLTGPLLAGD